MPKKSAAPIAVPDNPALKKRWQSLVATLRNDAGKGAVAFDHLWETAAEIVDHDPPLYLFGGYRSAAAFFKEVLHESERAARRNIRVARFATPEHEAKYGTHLLDATLGYLEAKTGSALDGSLPVDFDRLRIPIVRRGERLRLPLSEVTVAEVNAARREVLARKGRSRAKPSQDVTRLLATFAKHAALKGVVVHERQGLFTFQNVPAAAFGLFGRTVAAHRSSR